MADKLDSAYLCWHNEQIVFQPIGIIHSEHTSQEDTPIQGVFCSSPGWIEIYDEYVEGLKDISAFSHLILLYYFHRSTGCSLLCRPFLEQDVERGIFSIRHYNRPNPIGISIVDLVGIERNVLRIRGVDIIDGTPLLDIKPYVRQFDHREEVKSGWVDNRQTADINHDTSSPRRLRERGRAQH